MKVILCTHNSGGVGKTSLAVHIAGYLEAERGSVLLIDCDEQADAWKFHAGGQEPTEDKEFYSDPDKDVRVVYNPNRLSVKRIVKDRNYDYVVLDMDTPLPNIVTVILGSDPHLVLIPINVSQKNKALRNLEATLHTISDLEEKATFPPKVKIVPLGISEKAIKRVLDKFIDVPSNCSIAKKMDDLQEEMQRAIYEEFKYIWEDRKLIHIKDYFGSLIDI